MADHTETTVEGTEEKISRTFAECHIGNQANIACRQIA
jgi:hypothetical protein